MNSVQRQVLTKVNVIFFALFGSVKMSLSVTIAWWMSLIISEHCVTSATDPSAVFFVFFFLMFLIRPGGRFMCFYRTAMYRMFWNNGKVCCILTEQLAICRIHMHTRKDSGADFYFVILYVINPLPCLSICYWFNWLRSPWFNVSQVSSR